MSNRDHWSELSRTETTALGRNLVTERLIAQGWHVTPDADGRSSRLVATRSGVSADVFVSTQRLGGYAYWDKRRLVPAANTYAAIVLLQDHAPPALYLIPSVDWTAAAAPLTSRDYDGLPSEPEYGVLLTESDLTALARYAWTTGADVPAGASNG